jgi:hypothetical protein
LVWYNGANMRRDDNKKYEKPKPQKNIKSVSKKEKNSERVKSKHQLKEYWQSGFEQDNFEDEFMR